MNSSHHIHERGLTLVELLVAIAIGALLLAGATTLFVNNRATYEVTNDMARMQENARFAMETMVRDLRMAAYVGCINNASKVNNNIAGLAGELWDAGNLIEGINADESDPPAAPTNWLPSGSAGESGDDADLDVPTFHAASDAITVRYVRGSRELIGGDDDVPNLEVTNSVYSGGTTITVDDLPSGLFIQNMPAALSDCGAADVFIVTNDPDTAGNVVASGLSRAYDPVNRALLAPFTGARYFVRQTGDGRRALYRGFMLNNAGTLEERAEELVDGVETMQILYGVDTNADGDPNAFVDADGVTNWLSVLAVRVALLMRTIDEYGVEEQDGQRFQVADQKVCSDDVADADCTIFFNTDRRRRRVYDTTVLVRNLQ